MSHRVLLCPRRNPSCAKAPPPRDPGQPKSRAYPHPSKNTETNTNDDSESVIIKFGLSGFCSVLVENGLHEDPES